MAYNIIFSPEVLDYLAAFRVQQRRVILDAVEVQLTHEPTRRTKQRKPMRPNPLASWELRVGQFRVYYQVDDEDKNQQVVYVIAVGQKIRNQVLIGGKEVQL